MRKLCVGLCLGIALPLLGAGAQRTPFSAPASVALASPVVDVPLRKAGDFYFVDVVLDGRPFRFTLETGAGFFAVSQRAARALGLRVDSVEAVPGVRAPVVQIDSLRLGGATFRGLVARVNPAWDDDAFDGIVSASVLRNVLATVDLGGAALRLEQGALPEPNGRDIVAIVGQDRGGRVDIPVVLGDVTVPAVLDTRSLFWIIARDSLAPRLTLAAAPVFVTNAMGPSRGAFALRGARLTTSMSLASFTIARPAVMLRDRPGTVLGVPLMEQYVFTLDQRNGRVRVARGRPDPVVVPPAAWETGSASPGARVAATGGEPPSGTWTMGIAMAGVPGGGITILRVIAGSSAEASGLRAGDQLVEFDGVAAAQMNPGVSRAAATGGRPVRIVVLRDGRRIEATISPFRIP